MKVTSTERRMERNATIYGNKNMKENSPLEINEFARAKNPLGERFVLKLPLNRKRTSFSLGNTCEDDVIFSLPKHGETNS